MVATMAKMASVARKENLAKIGMRSFLNKVGAPYLHQLPKRCKAQSA
jgi:DNA-binding phage protein